MGADTPSPPENQTIEIPSRAEVLQALFKARSIQPPMFDNPNAPTGLSAKLFKTVPSKEKAREYITAMLSLMMPDRAKFDSLVDEETGEVRKMVQDDIGIFDLIDLSRKMELFDEFKVVFESIMLYRKMQFTFHNHLAHPDNLDNPQNIFACTLKSNAEAGMPSTIATIGCGDAFAEQALNNLGLIRSALGIEVDPEARRDVRGQLCDNFHVINVSSKDRNDKELKDRIFELTGTRDIYFFGDSLHHTDDPHSYIEQAWEQISPEGYLIVSEPFRFKADYITKDVMFPIDTTTHQQSMQSLTEHEVWINDLINKGGRVVSAKMRFGTEAGLNDSYHRVFIVVQKSAEENSDPAEEPWLFKANCPEFYDFLNPIYKKGKPTYKLNKPEDFDEQLLIELLEKLVSQMFTHMTFPNNDPIVANYLGVRRWAALKTAHTIKDYIFAKFIEDEESIAYLEEEIIKYFLNSEDLALFNELTFAIKDLNSAYELERYLLQVMGDFFEKHQVPFLTEGEADLIGTFAQQIERDPNIVIAQIITETRANDMIMTIAEVNTPDEAREIVRREIYPVVAFIRSLRLKLRAKSEPEEEPSPDPDGNRHK
ncbi:hypothetical protein ACFLZH_04225 [Patescibacteria group bacterium]